jgi:hypothetical protein
LKAIQSGAGGPGSADPQFGFRQQEAGFKFKGCKAIVFGQGLNRIQVVLRFKGPARINRHFGLRKAGPQVDHTIATLAPQRNRTPGAGPGLGGLALGKN